MFSCSMRLRKLGVSLRTPLPEMFGEIDVLQKVCSCPGVGT